MDEPTVVVWEFHTKYMSVLTFMRGLNVTVPWYPHDYLPACTRAYGYLSLFGAHEERSD